MSRSFTLDISPPQYHGFSNELDKSAFHKSLSVLAARVPPSRTGFFLRNDQLKNSILDLPKIRTVVPDPSNPSGDRLILLRASGKADLSNAARSFLEKEAVGLVNYNIELTYDYWTADEILQSFLPENLREGSPTGFAMTGHLAHVNLNEEYLPYKHIIGQLIMDKNPRVKTVVNKLNSIDTQFRFFKMELIAGEPNYIVEHNESDCRFTFDFSQVYWNSRLHTEHDRLVQWFNPEDVVADVFAGVGPFTVPAARKGCAVLSNDLNPNSAKYLLKNVTDNRVSDLVRVYCEDGRDFIRAAVRRVVEQPFAPYTGPRLSRTQEDKERRQGQKRTGEGKAPEPRFDPPAYRKRISHFVMNLPDSAITFLDAFRGILASTNDRDLSGVYDVMPMVHCHCFTRELEREKAKVEILQRAEEKLGHPIVEDVTLHLVRSVAPNKDMYCISFRLPRAAAFSMVE
ncbi:S-adenosyl-L-methionine-dependent methyltransferase [Cyathus striatus]|nr:S-adenosyl-L-methionine-dependent methyltransferase [Cyathus striatus]